MGCVVPSGCIHQGTFICHEQLLFPPLNASSSPKGMGKARLQPRWLSDSPGDGAAPAPTFPARAPGTGHRRPRSPRGCPQPCHRSQGWFWDLFSAGLVVRMACEGLQGLWLIISARPEAESLLFAALKLPSSLPQGVFKHTLITQSLFGAAQPFPGIARPQEPCPQPLVVLMGTGFCPANATPLPLCCFPPAGGSSSSFLSLFRSHSMFLGGQAEPGRILFHTCVFVLGRASALQHSEHFWGQVLPPSAWTSCLLPGEEQGTRSPCGVCPFGVLGWPQSPPGARSPMGWCRRGLGAGVCHSPPQNPTG